MPSGAQNIRNLQQIDSINVGDVLIVDTATGTKIIDYGDFTVSKDQVTFAGQLSSMEAAIGSNTNRTSTITGALLGGKQTLYVSGISSSNPMSGTEVWLRRVHEEQPVRIKVGNPDVLMISGSVSSAKVIYASGGNSLEWSSVYATTDAYSAAWTSTLTEVQTNSASWMSMNTDLGDNSAHWNSAYSTVCGQSAAWGGGSTKWTEPGGSVTHLTNNGNSVGIGTAAPGERLTVGGAVSAATIVYAGHGALTPGNSDSRQWVAAYTTVKSNSSSWASAAAGGWTDAGSVVRLTTASDKVGIGTTSPNHELTVIGSISATGDIYVSNSSLKFLDGTSWSSGDVSNLKSTSGNWQGTETTLRANSAAWADNLADLTNVANTSANWNWSHSNLLTGTDIWNSTNTDVNANSARWQTAVVKSTSVYTTVSSSSAEWEKANTTLRASSGQWESTKTTVRASSATWANASNNIFKTVTLSAQKTGAAIGADIVADSSTDTVILSAGPNIALISDPATDAITISASAPATGGVDGSGAAGYVPKWSDTDTLTNSVLTEVSSKVGVGLGSANPGQKLTVAGGVSALNVVYANAGNSDEWNSARTLLESTSGTWNTSGTVNHSASARRFAYYPAAGTTVDDVDEVYWDDTSDRLGIKSRFPTETLTVGGNISANGSLSATGADNNYIQGAVGIGIQTPGHKLTVLGDISASGNIYNTSGVIGSVSVDKGNSAFTTVSASSANWNTTYTRVASAHNSWDKANTTLNANSGGWESTKATVDANAANWTYVATNSTVSAAGGWTESTNVYVTNNSKSVGIGTSSPSTKLTVSGGISANGGLSGTGTVNYFDGKLGIGGSGDLYQYKLAVVTSDSDNLNGVLIDHNDTQAYYGLKIDSQASNAALLVQGAGTTITQDITGTQGLYVSRNLSEVGTNPLVTLFDDNSANTQTTLKVRQDGSGDIVNLLDGTTEVLTVLDGGNVGIGETAPDQKLTVVGNISASGTIYGTLNSTDDVKGDSAHTTVNAGSASWDLTTTRVNSAHNSWDKANTTLNSNSGVWTSTYSTVCANSAAWASTAAGGWSDGGAVVSLQTAGDRVSIGTTASGEKLTVAGGISGNYIYFNKGLSATGDAKFGTVNPIVIKSSTGKLGVNTEPTEQLHVAGTALFDTAASSSPHMVIAAQGTQDAFTIYDGTVAANRVILTVKDGGRVGIGTSNPTTTLTVSGSISAQGSVYIGNNSLIFADGNTFSTGTLSSSDSTYATMTTNSGSWDTTATRVASAHNEWDKTNTTVRSNSSNWSGINTFSLSGTSSDAHVSPSTYNVVFSAGPGINLIATSNVISISSSVASDNTAGNSSYTTTHDNSGYWAGVYSTVYNTSGDWHKAYTTVKANSGSWGGNGWQDDGTTIRLGTTSDNVVIGATTGSEKLTVAGSISSSGYYYSATSNSTQWESTHSNVNTNSGNWDTTYTRVNSAHVEWDKANTTLRSNSGNWDGTQSTVRANSATWNVALTSVGFTRNASTSAVTLPHANDKVGIGTSSPSDQLTVIGSISATGTSNVNSIIVANQPASGRELFGVRWSNSYDPTRIQDGIILQTGATETIYLSGRGVTVLSDISATGVYKAQHGTNTYSSADWSSTTIDVNSGKTSWDSVHSVVNSLSSTWSQSNSADTPKFDSVHSTVNATSSKWESGYTTYTMLSTVANNNVDGQVLTARISGSGSSRSQVQGSQIYANAATIAIGTGAQVTDANHRLLVDGGLSARTIEADIIKTNSLSGITTSVAIKLSGSGVAVLNITNGIITSVT